ncbi:19084_t:CDS:2 [Gigaspora margarita]|uniref:19084_t:CDS:1 n=1 Tax=Gigaspora margarita TaxID=4874 RepID=A0ABN7VA46_GIGMA|nr:19084_t:CDS:2 [Gigaspora margarita]
MFKFNPAECKNNVHKKIDDESLIINNHDKKEDIFDLSTIIKTKLDSKSDQFNSISKRMIDNATLNKISFCSKYNQTYDKNDKKTYTLFYCRSNRTINDYQILPTPNENHIIILHYGDYSTSQMEILFYRYMNCMLKNRNKHGKKYKTIKEIEESPTKLTNEPFDNHLQKDRNDNKKDDEKLQFSQYNKIRNRRMLSFYDFAESNKTHEFQYLRATKTNDTDLFKCITIRMNEMKMLYDTIENIKIQLKELRVLVEVSVKDLVKEFSHSEEDFKKDLKDLESLRKDHCQFKEEWTKSVREEKNEIRKKSQELIDLYNFYKFGERIIINEGVRCINGGVSTKTNDADLSNCISNCITFRMNEMNMLNDTIENIKFQLKELRVLFEDFVKKGLECHHSEEDLDDKNESDPDDYRINEIQQGIDIDKEKLKNKMITIVFNQ